MAISIRSTRMTAVLALAGLAAACTAQAPAPTTLVAGSVATVETPAPVEGYDWILSSGGGETRLVYGAEQSDDAVVGFSCADGSGRVELFSDTDPDHPAEFHLESGGDTARFVAETEPSPMSGGQFLTAQADSGQAVFQRFRRTGWLALWRGEDRAMLVSHPGAAQNVERFFAACG